MTLSSLDTPPGPSSTLFWQLPSSFCTPEIEKKKKPVYIITCVKRQSMQPTCFTSTKHKSEDTNFNRCHLNIVVGNKNEIMVIVGVAAMREGGIVHLLTHLLGA